ncbi:MAG: 30S ribosomal protein S8 [Sedimentisphaerales bacterium]|nr:30S ribosomal protein S8 [Sedimentisphaerales bacterium]
MSHCDPIADMLTRIRNAVSVEKPTVNIRASRVCEGVARVLKEQGYINDYDRINAGSHDELRIHLKYGPLGEKVIRHIQRYSKNSCREYCKVSDLPRIMGGLGITIVSTNMGVITDRECRQRNVGGEPLCIVY